ncbi:hypothetical protein SSAG_05338 [Streptomyces sp. Mg1]|nr:hypothetical protein SSAG_05338 [Streptomyces sp. Mg1]
MVMYIFMNFITIGHFFVLPFVVTLMSCSFKDELYLYFYLTYKIFCLKLVFSLSCSIFLFYFFVVKKIK